MLFSNSPSFFLGMSRGLSIWFIRANVVFIFQTLNQGANLVNIFLLLLVRVSVFWFFFVPSLNDVEHLFV